MAVNRRSSRQAGIRKRSVYIEPDTDDDLDSVSSHGAPSDEEHLGKRVRITTSSRRRNEVHTSLDELPDTSRKTRRPRLSKRKTRSQSGVTKTVNVIKIGKPRRRNMVKSVERQQVKPRTMIPSDGVIPQWQTLPFEVLKDIFTFAYSASDSHTWLLKAARICRAFAEPALTAYYNSPSLPSSMHLENFHAFLQTPREQQWIDYRAKVNRLELDTGAFTDRRDESKSFDLASIVAELPQLGEIHITTLRDKPPYRDHTLPRWRYPISLSESLDTYSRHLKSWRWNWLLIREARSSAASSDADVYEFLSATHLRPSFQTVQHLELSNCPTYSTKARREAHLRQVANIISLLPNLKSLALDSNEIVDFEFLPLLPQSLIRLRIANCPGLTSDALHAYMTQGGSCQLEELVLDHNVHLDLAFLPSLKTICPKLKVLRMDLHYYSQHFTTSDAGAKYEYLLGAQEHPTWPSTMQEIQLVHLQKWDSEGAKNLFQSLLDAADELLYLRKLVLHAHINIAWRDRMSFREKWISDLQRVFLEKSEPSTHLASFKAYRLWTAKRIDAYHSPPMSDNVQIIITQPRRLSTGSSSSSDEPLSTRRSKRIADIESASATGSLRQSGMQSDGVSIASSESRRSPDAGMVQGRCSIVDIRIDNQRPREEQLNESHFLDAEASGDDDWVPGREPAEETYAW